MHNYLPLLTDATPVKNAPHSAHSHAFNPIEKLQWMNIVGLVITHLLYVH